MKLTLWQRYGKLMQECFDPLLHAGFALLWFLSLYISLYLTNQQSGVSNYHFHGWIVIKSLIAVFSIFFSLFYLRIIEEVKNYDYDLVHNPKRPLIVGIVSIQQLVLLCLILFGGLIVINLGMGWQCPLLLMVFFFYSAGVFFIEKNFFLVRHNLLVNLLVNYPTHICLYFYVMMGINLVDWRVLWGLICAFLHYEIARKIAWGHHVSIDTKLYSQQWGMNLSIFISVVFALIAMILIGSATGNWFIVFAIIPIILGIIKLKQYRSKKLEEIKGKKLTPEVMGVAGKIFLASFYVLQILYGIIVIISNAMK